MSEMIDIKDRKESLRYLKVVEDILFDMAEEYSHTGMKEQAEMLYKAFSNVEQVRKYIYNLNESKEYEKRLGD